MRESSTRYYFSSWRTHGPCRSQSGLGKAVLDDPWLGMVRLVLLCEQFFCMYNVILGSILIMVALLGMAGNTGKGQIPYVYCPILGIILGID